MNIKRGTSINKLREEALAWLDEHGPSGLFGPFPSRSCWECNSAHEHLKRADCPIHCFACGRIFFQGVDITDYDED